MSDILVHAAIVENQKAIQEFVARSINPTAVISETPFRSSTELTGVPLRGTQWSNTSLTNCPQIVRSWNQYLAPLVTRNHAFGFRVCDTSSSFRSGVCCLFTVPTGVSRVQFQLWGPGGGTSGQCCCGGSPFGPSGAYMVASLNVTPGQTYTLCSGCAVCCWATETTPGRDQGPTWIQGPGLSVCAEGGESIYSRWHTDLGSTNSSTQIPAQDNCGPSQCSGWNFCWDSSNDNTTIPHSFSSRTWRVLCSDTSRAQSYAGIPGLWPAFTLGNDLHTGCTISTPVFGFENCVCTFSYTGSNTTSNGQAGCHRRADLGWLQIPGAGGWATYSCGGQDSNGGDSGRMGMICVSYNCG